MELLRIVALLLICTSHAVQTSENFLYFYNILSVSAVFLRILRYSGQIGNVLFVICSSWFSADSKKTKADKALNLFIDSAFISMFILIGFLIGEYKFSAVQILRQIIPDLWFIPVYAFFYILHPLFNGAIGKMNQKTHFIFVFFAAIAGVVNIFIELPTILINQLVNFIIVYFIVAYMKKYMVDFCSSVKKNLIGFCMFFGVFLICATVKQVLGVSISFFYNIALDGFFSPILLPMLLCLFNLFNLLKFKNMVINYFASCSLFVYCFHENPLLRTYIRPAYYRYMLDVNPNLHIVWILICAIGMFIGAFILSVIYKETIHRLTAFLSKKICSLCAKFINFIYGKFSDNSKNSELNEL